MPNERDTCRIRSSSAEPDSRHTETTSGKTAGQCSMSASTAHTESAVAAGRTRARLSCAAAGFAAVASATRSPSSSHPVSRARDRKRVV